jgi:hypothetical protein
MLFTSYSNWKGTPNSEHNSPVERNDEELNGSEAVVFWILMAYLLCNRENPRCSHTGSDRSQIVGLLKRPASQPHYSANKTSALPNASVSKRVRASSLFPSI